MKMTGRTSSRSEEIRRRKLKAATATPAPQVVPKKRRNRVVSTPPLPVMARTPIAGISQPVSKGTRKTRKFHNFSLNPTYGTEMRLPSLPGISLSWRLVSFVLAAALVGALYFFWESPSFRVDAPKIGGLQRLNANMVNSELGLIGEQIFLMDAARLETDLLSAFPEFSAARVEVSLPNSVSITVTERVPVLSWVREGESILVDAEGMPFPDRGSVSAGSYPTIESSANPPGAVATELVTENMREAAIQRITGVFLSQEAAQEPQAPLLPPEMVESILIVAEQAPDGSKLLYDAIHGLGWTDRRGWKVYLGEAQDMDVKIQIYRAIMESLKGDEIRPAIISVESVHAPYYRLDERAEE